MCYASPVMLRGRCSCAISGRPTPSSFASSSLFPPLSALFPLHPRNSPVTPLFPLLTQKQGGGGGVTHMVTFLKYVGASTFSFRESIIAIHQNAGSSSALAVNCQLSTVNCPSPAPLATAALQVVPAPICTTTLRIHVGSPTILECGGSPPLLRLTQERQMNCWGETDRIAKAGASSRTPK